MSMTRNVLRGLLAVAAIVALPLMAYAQQQTLSGTVTDATGKPVAAVAIAATHVDSNTTQNTVSDAQGGYRLPMRTGAYIVTYKAAGFATVQRTGVDLLLGQQGIVNIQLTPSTEARTITVTGDVEIQNAGGSTNFDAKRTDETPINGRDVASIAQGAVGNAQRAQSELPVDTGTGTFQTNYDGQRVTQNLAGGFGQTRYSRDALGQIEFVQNRFDASSGSAGAQMNAATKSGANKPAGTFSGFFRSDKFNTGDFLTVPADKLSDPACAAPANLSASLPSQCRKVLPYSDQQFSATYGGPIIKDKLHYFVNFEYERNPHTLSYNTGYKTFDAVTQLSELTQKIGMARFDYTISPKSRLAIRGNESTYLDPIDARYGGGNARAPSTPLKTHRHSDDVTAIFTQVLSARALNQVNLGYASFYWWQDPVISWSTGCGYVVCQPYPSLANGSMIVSYPGITVGNSHTNSYQRLEQDTISVTDNFSYSFNAKGAHTIKIGGNYLSVQDPVFICNTCMGNIKISSLPATTNALAVIPGVGNLGTPTDGSFESLFPGASLNQKFWNLTPLSPFTDSYTVGLGQMQVYAPMKIAGIFLQDDWKVNGNFTLNLGVRYDYESGVWAEDFDAVAGGVGKWLANDRPIYNKEFAPRIGFSYKLNAKQTLRGGWGLYWVDPGNNTAFWTHIWGQGTTMVINNPTPGKASNFASDPFNCLGNPSGCGTTPAGGKAPTLSQVLTSLCSAQNITDPAKITSSGCLRRTTSGAFASNDNRIPYNYNTSVGLGQQLTKNSAIGIDFVYTQNRQGIATPNQNLAYNTANGTNFNATSDLAHLPDPQWQSISGKNMNAESNQYQVQGGFTKRNANKWAMGATYLWQRTQNHDVYPVPYNLPENFGQRCSAPVTFVSAGSFSCTTPITLAPYINDDSWYNSPNSQKITLNGNYTAPWGVTVGLNYLWGNSGYSTPSYSYNTTTFFGVSGYRFVPTNAKAPVAAASAFVPTCTTANSDVFGGCLIARNTVQTPDISKLDMRVTKVINTGTRVKLNAVLEVFNLLNRVNYSGIATGSTNATFGQPSTSTNITYYPRMAQVSFRATF